MNRRTTLATLAALASHALVPECSRPGRRRRCRRRGAAWQPRALTPAGGAQLAALVDAILPDTDTPGAARRRRPRLRRPRRRRVPARRRTRGVPHRPRRARTPPAGARTASISTAPRRRPSRRCCATPKPPAAPFVKALKSLTVLGYGTSRIGATQALADDQVPGRYRGCVDLAPGQRTWAER